MPRTSPPSRLLRRALAGLATGVVLMGPLAFAGSAEAEETVVRLGHGRIEPAEVEVAVGEEVVFVNEDAMPGGHTVMADDQAFHSPALAKGQRWSVRFDSPGRRSFHLVQHPKARGAVVVVEESAE